jgi:hypothetical protein
LDCSNSGLCQMIGFGVRNIEYLGSATKELIMLVAASQI